ncbi:hypothetical protein Hanom_Chr03g00245481 [Helianthus anomalus]
MIQEGQETMIHHHRLHYRGIRSSAGVHEGGREWEYMKAERRWLLESHRVQIINGL